VYPVADSSWLEGGANGIDGSSKEGPGLKWIEVDTNGDGLLDELDESPYVPDFSRPVASLGPVSQKGVLEVDVTAAFDGGAGVYTLAIASASSDGATYWSRDRWRPDQRPMLHLETEPQVIPAP